MIENLTTATPVEVDTAIADIYERGYKARRDAATVLGYLKDYRKGNARLHEGHRSYSAYTDEKVTEWEAKYDNAVIAARAIFDEAIPFEAEWVRRGRWTRAFLVVTRGTGHVHSSMYCSTCYETTEFAWLPQMSGKDEAEIVEAAGERACTVCYPSAPVEALARPTTLFSKDEITKQAEREAKAAAKAAKEADKAAKAITDVDGSPLRNGHGWVVATERSAEIEYVDDAAYVQACNSGYPHKGRLDTASAYCERFIAAVAAKHDTTIEEEVTRLSPKVNKRYKRDYA